MNECGSAQPNAETPATNASTTMTAMLPELLAQNPMNATIIPAEFVLLAHIMPIVMSKVPHAANPMFANTILVEFAIAALIIQIARCPANLALMDAL